MTHKIVVVYHSLLGIYGDRGNAKVLLKRLQWRGEPAELVDVEPGQPLPPDGLVYLLGGGEDQAQIAAVKQLQTDRGLHEIVPRGQALPFAADFRPSGPHRFVAPGDSAEQWFDHIEDRTLRSYAGILEEGRSPFEPAGRVSYRR